MLYYDMYRSMRYWFRMTCELNGDLGIESRQYGQQGYGVTAVLTWGVGLIDLGDDHMRADHKEVLILSWVI